MKKKLLAVIMALAMMMSLMPATAFAAGGIDSTKALQDALNAGNDVTLDGDITGDFTVPSGKSVTLDLNGYTLTNSTGDTITVEYGASLTITDGSKAKTGTVDNKSHAKGAIFNNGTVVLSGGTYDRSEEAGTSEGNGGNSWYTICNHGDMTINAGVTVKNKGGYSSMIENGYQSYTGSSKHGNYAYNYAAGVNSANPTLTINGGTFTGGLNSVKNDDGGIVTINNGTFTNTTQAAVLNWNKATITGGTFTVNAAGYNCILNGASVLPASAQDLGQLTITGGSFTSPAGVDSVANNITGGALTITGGTFSSDVSVFVGADSVVTEKDGKFVVEALTADNAVASIGNTYYKTLADAVAAVEDGGTVKMLKNASGAGIGTFKGDPKYGVKNFTIDFGSFTYTCTGPAVGSTGTESQAFHLEKGAAVTLKNGTITSTADSGVYMLVQNYCNLTLEDMTLDGTNIGAGQYTMSNNCGNVNITGATSITAPTNGFAFDACWAPNKGYPEGAQVTVNTTGVISGKVEFGLWGTMSEGDVKTTLTIKNGTFNGSIVVGSGLVDASKTNLTITGGTFSTKPDDAYIANGYEFSSTNPWVVSPSAGMEADATASGSSVSASVTGTWTGNESQEDGNKVESSNSSIAIDVTTGEDDITSTAVTIDSATLESVQDATVSTVAISTDVGTLTVNKQAWSAMTDNADGSSVTLSMEKDDSSGLVYTLTAVDTDGNPVFAEGESKGSITVTVNYIGSNPTVYYVGTNGLEKLTSTFQNGELSWSVAHFSDYLIQDGDSAISYKTTGSQVQFTNDLKVALEAVKAGGTVTVHEDVAATEVNTTITGAVTINGPGKIDITAASGKTTKAFTISNGGSLTLDGAKMIIKGTEDPTAASDYDGYGIDVQYGAALELKNQASLAFQGLNAATISSKSTGTVPGVFKINNSTLTATEIEGNFSNGGTWEITNGSSVTIDGCDSHGLSADAVTVDGSALSISNVGYRGISINGSNGVDGKLDIKNNATVTVTDCGSETRDPVYVTSAADSPSLSVDNTSKLAVTGTYDTINIEGTTPKLDLDGQVIGSIKGIKAEYNGTGYTSLSDALTAANSSGGTVTLVADDSLTTPIDGDVTLVVPSGVTLTVARTNLTTLFGSAGKVQVQAGGTLVVDSIEMIGGSDANINLKSGSIELKVSSSALDLSFVGASAEIPSGKRWTLLLNGTYPMNVTLDNSTTLTVTSTGDSSENDGFRVANNATLTNNGKVVVNGVMSVSTNGTVAGSGTIQVSGVLVNRNADAAKMGNSITLASGGKVYSAADISGKLSNVGALSDKTYNGETFGYAWNYYVPSGGGSSTPTYSTTVEKAENGTVTVSPQNASKGSTVTITVKPNEGFALDKLTVTDKDGKEIELTKKNDTQYTFTMPASKVTVKATFAAVSTLPFTDVDVDDWYYEAVKYAYDNDLMNGMGNNRFAPNTTLSRGMIAQVLYNLEKNPAAGSGSFTDVTSGAWYADAVNWAAANDIVNGYSDGTFAPNKDITRQEMATILYRYAQYKGYDTSAKGDLSVFTDGAKTGDWAKDAMVWAVGAGLLEGHAGAVNPTGTATRAEVATILMRFCENIAK